MAQPSSNKTKQWYEKISRSGYFFGALLLHLVVFLMVATWVIFPAFHPPTDDFTKTYLPPSAPPPPPPPPSPPTPQVSTHAVSAPTTITAPTAAPAFNVPMPDLTPATATPVNVQQSMTQQVVSKPNTLSEARLTKIMDTEKSWGRDKENILESNSDPKNITAKFPVYLASYADGDWGCNIHLDASGKIDAGSLPDLVAKMNEWSHGHITGEVVPTPLNIGGPDLLEKKPPFIFFTGHKDFKLTDQEIQNLSEYLQIGGAIWGDNTLAGRGSRFDVAFRREMKRVVPDLDKNFEPVPMTGDVYTKSWFPISKVPTGMNFYAEPIEHLDIDGKLAILYTPNDYSDLFFMRILPGDTQMERTSPNLRTTSPLFTSGVFLDNSGVFFRNFTLPSCLAAQQLGMNIVGYMLVRFDKDLLLTP
jgi:hypothetical protein